jgi:hypothetical protein
MRSIAVELSEARTLRAALASGELRLSRRGRDETLTEIRYLELEIAFLERVLRRGSA